MCGIVGIYLAHSRCDPEVVSAMRDLLTHRGPDDAGAYVDGPLGLGHRRLSIIDLSSGHQPMSTPDGRWTIVFNGEIYNYRALRKELEAEGAEFLTSSDTEVILHLHARRGAAAARSLNGIFAYAVWDSEERRLWLARDRAGIKPLYYVQTSEGFAFASEIKSLFESGLAKPSLAREHLAEYLLFRHVAGTRNLFQGISSLPPGHLVQVDLGVLQQPSAYWSPDEQPQPFAGDYREAVDRLDEVLLEAVDRQLMSDVPLGTFCSGGIDSSLVTAMAARCAGRQIDTFSVAFDDVAYDESRFAQAASKSCGTRHHEIRVDEARFADLLPTLIWHHDLPLNFANSVHIFAVSELARWYVTVVLTGEGADELFGGYPRYSVPRIAQLMGVLPEANRRAVAGRLLGTSNHRLRRLGAVLGGTLDDALLLNSATIRREDIDRILGRPAGDWALPWRSALVAGTRERTPDVYEAMSRLDFSTYLLSILNRQDKMSMAASIESRVPFLDNEVIDLAWALPQRFKQSLWGRKKVLKSVALRYLPAEIVRRKKSGFGVPLAEWFRGDGAMSALLEDVVSTDAVSEIFQNKMLELLIAEHKARRKDHGELLWGVLNVGLWRRTFRC